MAIQVALCCIAICPSRELSYRYRLIPNPPNHEIVTRISVELKNEVILL
jgi:hypothetical protein